MLQDERIDRERRKEREYGGKGGSGNHSKQFPSDWMIEVNL